VWKKSVSFPFDEGASRRVKSMKVEGFDKGEDITKYLDFSKARHPGRE